MSGRVTPVCATWCFFLVASIILFRFHPEYKKELHLDWRSIIKGGQQYRLITNFLCFGGKFDMASMINLFFLCQSGMRIELGRSFRFLLALSLCGTGLLYCDYHRLFYTRHSPWTSHRLILSLICLESWSHPTELTTLPPLPLPPFPCWLLPAMICAQNHFLFGAPWQSMIAPAACSLVCAVILMIYDELSFMVFSRTHIKDPTRLNELLGEHGQPGSRKSNKYVDVDQDMSADWGKNLSNVPIDQVF
ncbi:hypothetical protein GUITHDRAFT_153147 [Guillardia theta CCMP2712]|uniref:Derlin n=1 Tax=Guillardia theta (strain CCMP2712) TaxID=905079 RepID=L1J6G8_GUITC|nr:hypothetical protein GUITHDRAFT_153147 [Guillardia theta CCMP2712]EKX43699.1 hypothetical protein GUITHDRAFT_153147 [Guillardia theta CCMP2712]|eukprot:XP_005830679.1 hypothetical protein GUITHDRAFT_153147 [Guillardia theta CCMP2712]